MNRYARFAAFLALAGSVTGAVGSITLAGPPTQRTAGPTSLGDLFVSPTSTTLKPGAADRLQAAVPTPVVPRPGECPEETNVKVIVRQGDVRQDPNVAAGPGNPLYQ